MIRATSRFFATPAFPAGSGPDFVNAVIMLEASLPAQGLLGVLHQIERDMGRQRTARWGPRTLDLDLLAQGDQIAPDRETFEHWANLPLNAQMAAVPDQLILPHPRLAERAFVLVPLSEIAPDWVHPVTGQSVLQMRNALPDSLLKQVRLLQ